MNWRRIAIATLILMFRDSERGFFSSIFCNRVDGQQGSPKSVQECPNLFKTFNTIRREIEDDFKEHLTREIICIAERLFDKQGWKSRELSELSQKAKKTRRQCKLTIAIPEQYDQEDLKKIERVIASLMKRAKSSRQKPPNEKTWSSALQAIQNSHQLKDQEAIYETQI